MQKFLVLYMCPSSVIEAWKATPEAERNAAEEKMKGEWGAWMQKNHGAIIETAGAGATKRVTAEGVIDTKNDVMLYSLVSAESHDAAAALFVGHPHLGIPGATIELMTANMLPGMSDIS